MGLDIVEIWMACEEDFGVEIPEEEFEELRTVGDLYACILRKVRFLESPGCPSTKVFYRLRRGLTNALGTSREAVRPKASMEELVPLDGRRRSWRAISQSMALVLPPLARPAWVRWAVAVPVMALIAAAIVLAVMQRAVLWAPFGMLIGGLLAYAIVLQATAALATVLPSECTTVGSTVKAVMRLNFGREPTPPPGQSDEDIWNTLRGIFVKELGIEPDRVTRDTRFKQDLRID